MADTELKQKKIDIEKALGEGGESSRVGFVRSYKCFGFDGQVNTEPMQNFGKKAS